MTENDDCAAPDVEPEEIEGPFTPRQGRSDPQDAPIPTLGAYLTALEQARADEAAQEARIAELQREIDALAARRDDARGLATALQAYVDRMPIQPAADR